MTSIGNVHISKDKSPKIMGIINVSPESFYKKSVRLTDDMIQDTVIEMHKNGVDLIDLGGMSTAPYLETFIPINLEIDRLKKAICAIRQVSNIPISIDTIRSDVVRPLLKYDVDAINDITGLKYDQNMSSVAFKCGLPVILGAYSKANDCTITGGISDTVFFLSQSIKIAHEVGLHDDDLILDPSIGFFRKEGKNLFYSKINALEWYIRDIDVISNIRSLGHMSKPICVSISGKSFIGSLMDLNISDRLIPSIVAEIHCILNGVSLIRTHNVRETRLAINMLELLK